MKIILVTVCAGHSGNHACKLLARAGYTPVVLDTFRHASRAVSAASAAD